MLLDPLRVQDWKCLLKALHHNNWFTSIIAESIPIDKEVFTQLAEVFQYNITIQQLTLRDVKASSQFFISLSNALEANPKTNIQQIDFSSNEMEVMIIHLSNFFFSTLKENNF